MSSTPASRWSEVGWVICPRCGCGQDHPDGFNGPRDDFPCPNCWAELRLLDIDRATDCWRWGLVPEAHIPEIQLNVSEVKLTATERHCEWPGLEIVPYLNAYTGEGK